LKLIKLFALFILTMLVMGCIGQPVEKSTTRNPQSSTSTPSQVSPSPQGEIDVHPPSILDFNWTPTKIVWDKIYDIEVNFSVEDDKTPIKYAELHFIPVEYKYFITKYGMRPEDYPKVFPPDKERVYVLKPIDGKFDELKEEFSADIKNITGGREYKIVAVVKDAAGNKRTVEIKTPYIRQFPNLGRFLYEGGRLTPEELRTIGNTPGYEEFLKLADEDKTLEFEGGIIIAVTYYPYYPLPGLEPWAVHPLMGKYDVRDPIVIAKHIDWATGYGINCFFLGWGSEDKNFQDATTSNINVFSSNSLFDQILIAIQYEGIPTKLIDAEERDGQYILSNSEEWKNVKEDFKFLNKWIFNSSNYLKMNNNHVVYIGYSSALEGSVKDFVEDINSIRKLFLIADHAHPWAATSAYTVNNSGGWVEECDASGGCELINYAKVFDGWTVWAAGWYTPIKEPLNETYPLFLKEGYTIWNSLAQKYNKMFIPSIIPGYIYLGDPDEPRLPRDAHMFRKELEIAFNLSKMVKIDTFNDFGEATGIEPTHEEGFAYLETLKQVLEEYLDNLTSPKPQVLDFNWTPTKVVWDKVYDIKVRFKLSYLADEISSVKLIFRPENYSYFVSDYGMRPEDYYKVFPNDSRVYELKPVDGTFDENEEEFKVEVKNITGGAEYWIIIQIQTKDGRTVEYKTKTPYIRQYENNAKKDDIIVMASYMPWFTDSSWVNDHNFKGYPLLGAYVLSDPMVVYKHADWATGYGIDAFLMNWNGADKSGDSNTLRILHLLKNFRGGPKIGILWGPELGVMINDEYGEYYNMSIEHNREEFLNEMKYIASEYMNDPLYLKLENRPVIYFYQSNALRGNISQIMEECRKIIKNETGMDPFIFGEEIGWLFTFPEDWLNIEGNSLARLKLFDAVSDWAGAHDRSNQDFIVNYLKYLDHLYHEWNSFLKKQDVGFVPSAIPGFDEIYIYYEPDLPPIPKTPSLFEERLEIALRYMDPSLKMIRIDTWNDWGEWSNVEPTSEEGFVFLETLKEVLEEYMEKQEKD